MLLILSLIGYCVVKAWMNKVDVRRVRGVRLTRRLATAAARKQANINDSRR